MLTSDVENYPGFPDGIQGPELMQKFREQAERFGTRSSTPTSSRSTSPAGPFRLWADKREYTADSVIVATGASALWLGPRQRDQRLRGRGVSACATCDGFFFRGKKVAVVGGGDTALEEATFLTRRLPPREAPDDLDLGRGVFAAGDVADHIYRQAVSAAGEGCKSAIDAERWLASR
jgi:thioredoxin reductase (NADPH)